MNKSLPTIFALCGWPKSGKDEVARVIQKYTNGKHVDDAMPLRQAAPILFSFDPSYPFSQDGKSKKITTADGRKHEVRQLMGDLGMMMEEKYGDQFIPRSAVLACEVYKVTENVENFIISSCRRNNGKTYKENNGLVIEVRRPGVGPSEYEFDKWEEDFVDCVIVNDGTIEQLENAVNFWLERFETLGPVNISASEVAELYSCDDVV